MSVYVGIDVHRAVAGAGRDDDAPGSEVVTGVEVHHVQKRAISEQAAGGRGEHDGRREPGEPAGRLDRRSRGR